MRPFRLKKTITHATVLSALFPSVAALSQQLPVGFYEKITTVSAGAAAILGHELVPAGTALNDPSKAPSRGGYVYDSFNSVVRSGITRECVKHGLWSLEAATPDCEPWLFAAPAPKAAAPAPAPAPKAAAPAPAPAAPKEEGFPEWMGPGEATLGIVPLWAEDGIEPEDAVGASVMHFGSDEDDGAATPETISDPIHYGDHEEDSSNGGPELLAAPLVYFDDGDDAAVGDDLIGAPIAHDDNDGMAHLSAEQWPADPHASGDQEPETGSNDNWVPAPAGEIASDDVTAMQSFDEQWSADPHASGEGETETAGNDNWVPAPGEEKAEEPGHSMLEFKEEEQWPGDSLAGQDEDRQTVTEDDTSWLIPNPLPESPADEMVGRYEEDAKGPEETIVGHSVYHEEDATEPEDAIAGHSVFHEEDATEPEDAIVGHSIYHEDGSSGAEAVDENISFPQHYAEEEDAPSEPEQMAVAPYKSPYDDQPYAQAADEDEEEMEAFTSHFDVSPPAAIVEPPPVLAAVPKAPEPSQFPEEPEEDDEEQQPYSADYSKVPTAKVEPAPAMPPAKPAPVAEEEHLMTVVLSADALFDFDRYVLRPAGKKSLDDFVAALQDVKWGHILVVGHSDRLGSAKYNLRLSERRAQAVRKELIAKGLDGKKIKAAGKGKAQPVSSGCVGTKRTKALIACLQPDRRVEIFVDEKREVKITKPVKPKK
ncbi:MAG: OmpA family protein [Burkholderiales bacterium]